MSGAMNLWQHTNAGQHGSMSYWLTPESLYQRLTKGLDTSD